MHHTDALDAPSLQSFTAQFGVLGFVSQQKLAAALESVAGEDLWAYMDQTRALCTADMLGWERVEVATVLAAVPAALRPTFVGTIHVMGAQVLLPLRWAPERVGAHAMRAVVAATAQVEPNDWAAWVACLQRLCGRNIEYFDAAHVVTALATLEPGLWADFILTVEQLFPATLDSHNRTQIVVMLAHSKIVEEKRSRLIEHCEPLRAGGMDAVALRETIANFLGAGAQA